MMAITYCFVPGRTCNGMCRAFKNGDCRILIAIETAITRM